VNYDRYINQLKVDGFSVNDLKKLQSARVLVVGAGGLGCPVSLQLVAMGIGTITLIDDDLVEVHNLNRQTLFTPNQVGIAKVEAALSALKGFNPDCNIMTIEDRLSSRNAKSIIDSHDLVIDCTDNIPARYTIDKYCNTLGIPMIFGGVRMLEGQFGVFNYQKGISFTDVYPPSSNLEQLEDCESLGTFGFACALIASHQVNEAYKILLEKPGVQDGKIVTIDLQRNTVLSIGKT